MCHGGPVRTEIETRQADGLDAATNAALSVILERYGATDIEAPMRAILATGRVAPSS